jgi:hypothetical protein
MPGPAAFALLARVAAGIGLVGAWSCALVVLVVSNALAVRRSRRQAVPERVGQRSPST